MLTPTVSVIVWTFNHEHFIARSIEGILNQETSFPVEIIIHDDASTDSTRSILESYQRSQTNKIRLVFPESNCFSRGVNFVPDLIRSANGRYAAFCDGDDYWTCSDKLQTQFDLMESNPVASGCFHRADDLDQSSGNILSSYWGPISSEPFFTIDDLFRNGNSIPTASLFFRRAWLTDLQGTLEETPFGDLAILVNLLTKGPLVYCNQSMSVYRRHKSGHHSSADRSTSLLRYLTTLYFASIHSGISTDSRTMDAFRGLQSDLNKQLKSDRSDRDLLRQENSRLQAEINRISQSKAFRAGVRIHKLLNRLGILIDSRKTNHG